MIPTHSAISSQPYHVGESSSASGGAAAAEPPAHEQSEVARLGAAALAMHPEDADMVRRGGSVRLSPQGADNMAAQTHVAAVLGEAVLAEADAAQAMLPPADRRLAQNTLEVLTRIAQASGHHDRTAAATEFSVGATQKLAKMVVEHLDKLEANRPQNFGEMDVHERMAETVSCISKWLLRNESDSTGGRLAGNFAPVALRSGIATLIGTFLRNWAGFTMQRTLNFHRASNGGMLPEATAHMLNIGGGVLLAIPAVLHVIGGIRDAVNGQGTRESHNGRVAQAGISLALTATAAATGNFETLTALNTAVLIYSAARAFGGITVGNSSNQGAQSNRALAVSTVAYSSAQALGSMVQDAAGWNASVSDPNIRLTDTTGATRTSAQIASTEHNYGGNAGHSVLNASLEVFDDLQTGAIARYVNVGENRKRWKEFGPEKQAQTIAAGMHAYVNTCRADPGQALGPAGRESAFVAGMRSHQNSELEGLRISLSRTQPTREAVLARAQRSSNELATLGYTYTRNALERSPEEQANRIVVAYVAQSITALQLQQPLAGPGGGSWGAFGTRAANQMSVEAQRQGIFHSIYAGLYAVPSLPADPNRSPTVDSALGGLELAAIVSAAYPTFVGALSSRAAPTADVDHQQALQAQVDAITQGGNTAVVPAHAAIPPEDLELQEVRVQQQQPLREFLADPNERETRV